MNQDDIVKFYKNRNLRDTEQKEALAQFSLFSEFLSGKDIKEAQKPETDEYLEKLIESGKNSLLKLTAFARLLFISGNRDMYIYMLQILEREDIAVNLLSHVEEKKGKELRTEIESSGLFPVPGLPPEAVLPFTANLLEIVTRELNETEQRLVLRCNAHGIPDKAFAREKEFFEKSELLEQYLEGFHRRSVENLEEHAASGEVWFEQIITPGVVEYVRANKEVLGGVLDRGKSRIYITKFPYNPSEWLKEKDPGLRRYLYCHCPMAREVLNPERAISDPPEEIDPVWCNCSGGFASLKYNVLFGEETEVEVLQSVLAGDSKCRFAVTVPERFL